MPDSRILSIIGAGLLLAGLFMPVVSVPLFGSMSLVQYNSNDALVIALLSAGTFILTGTRRTQLVLWTGIGALAMLAYSFVRLQSQMSELRSRIESELSGTAFGSLAEAALGSVQVRWGWGILVLGAALIIWAGIQAWRERRSEAADRWPGDPL